VDFSPEHPAFAELHAFAERLWRLINLDVAVTA
jgi:hypothetical protein